MILILRLYFSQLILWNVINWYVRETLAASQHVGVFLRKPFYTMSDVRHNNDYWLSSSQRKWMQ